MLFSRATSLPLQTFCKRFLTLNAQRPRPEGKHYRLWAMPGDQVRMKEVLAKQWSIEWIPGLNTGIDKWRSIYALCDGIMLITEEEFKPDWTNPDIQDFYASQGVKRAPLYMRYIHVIPKKRVSEFKLVDLV